MRNMPSVISNTLCKFKWQNLSSSSGFQLHSALENASADFSVKIIHALFCVDCLLHMKVRCNTERLTDIFQSTCKSILSELISYLLTLYCRQEAFRWKSLHGKLYANRDLCRFKIKDERCSYCNEPKQTIRHLYNDCRLTQIANFRKQYGIKSAISDAEKLIGLNPVGGHTFINQKRFCILRKYIYDSNRHDTRPTWEGYMELVDRIYTYEYSIADKKDKPLKHLQIWEK